MTLTLPTPDAGDTARQRFALELLLQQPVPGPEQLLASRNLLNDALPDVGPDQWRALQAIPIAIGADHLDIAIPSRWRDQEWQHLIDQLPEQDRTIRLHPAIESDLQRALHAETEDAETNPSPAPAEPASTLDLSAESFLHDFSPDGVLESDEDDDAFDESTVGTSFSPSTETRRRRASRARAARPRLRRSFLPPTCTRQ